MPGRTSVQPDEGGRVSERQMGPPAKERVAPIAYLGDRKPSGPGATSDVTAAGAFPGRPSVPAAHLRHRWGPARRARARGGSRHASS